MARQSSPKPDQRLRLDHPTARADERRSATEEERARHATADARALELAECVLAEPAASE